MFGLVEPCVCGQVQWCACSVKQVNWINLQVYIIVLVETNYILVNEHSLSLSNGIFIAKLLILILIFFFKSQPPYQVKKERNE